MATDKPRITITLSTEQHEVLKRLSALQKAPMSRIISELLEEVTPVLSNVADSLEIAMRAQAGVKANIKRVAQEAEEDLRPLVEFAKSQFSLFTEELSRMVDGAPTDAGCAHSEEPAAVGSPRPVITGATRVQRRTKNGRGESSAVVKAAATSASPRAK